MKLVTFNMQWGLGVDGRVSLPRIVQAARAMADFDVLCLQEVADHYPALKGNTDMNQFDSLAALLPGFAAIEGIGVDVEGDGRRRRFGNMILTRLPVLSVRRHALPWPADPSVSSMPRVAIEATLAMPMGPVRVTTTHLEYYSAIQRNAQVQRLRELHDESCGRARAPAPSETSRGPFDTTPQATSAILTADFNFPPEDAAHEDLMAPLASGGPAYRDAWQVAHPRQPHPPTFCVHDRTWRDQPYCCDFIYVSEDLAAHVRSVTVDTATQASDHQPVLLELDDRR
jgi:endonuclease/exonuclease/phosphatase family metal-dependent hydrolase